MNLTHYIQDNVCIVGLAGELILGQAYQLIPQIRSLLADVQPKALVVNMHAVTKFDSAGIASIVTFYKDAKEQQVEFAVCQLSEESNASLRAVLLDEIPIYDTEQDALNSLA
ncbi:MAG: STAS domain-containing protein [SAR324 cluster bacterium]|nr:STAS domain-containing protein [SAR324 cluster bacterium]